MTRRRFVEPDTTRLELSDGDWIEIKTTLGYGEVQAMRQAAMRPLRVSEGMESDEVTIDLDPFILQQKRMELYLTDWSFRGADDKPVPLTRGNIALLDPDTANEVSAAIVQHEADQRAKKATGGSPK